MRLLDWRIVLAILPVVFQPHWGRCETDHAKPFEIQVLDRETGWPVPLIELETNHHLRFVSDNAGRIAIDAPELYGVSTWLHVRGHGYSVPADGFGYRGLRVTPHRGQKTKVFVDREQPAFRLGRITGAGLFAESQKLGFDLDWQESGVMGCDSVQNAIYQGKYFWAWGDTTLPSYPLGRFHMTGATTPLDQQLSITPPVKVHYQYFRGEDSAPRDLAKFPGDGPTWLSGLAALPDQQGRNKLVGSYSKIRPPMTEYESGLCVWNDQARRFDRMSVLWKLSEDDRQPMQLPSGHSSIVTGEDGERWIFFGDPLPTLKCRAEFESWSNPDRWVHLQPQKQILTVDESSRIEPHRGAIAWHPIVKKWVCIFTRHNGEDSFLGEIWFAMSENPEGPWHGAVKVATHDTYTFYNPQVHSPFQDGEDPILLFEATYTKTFSKAERATSRWDYNQVLYRLNLKDVISN